MDDLISRQAAIDEIQHAFDRETILNSFVRKVAIDALNAMPSAQPTLYGYKIEHLAYIATVMEKEGVTADYAVRTFDDISRVIKMIIDEIQQKIEEALNE